MVSKILMGLPGKVERVETRKTTQGAPESNLVGSLPPSGPGEYVADLTVTSYNPEPGQTDSTPCIAGGTGRNVCNMARNGRSPIALSQEFLNWAVSAPNGKKRFNSGDNIRLEQIGGNDPRCNGVFEVVDAMNIRYRNRADLFFMSRKDNTSCKAKMYAL